MWLYIYISFCIFSPVSKIPQVIINKQNDEDGRLGSITEPLGVGTCLLEPTVCMLRGSPGAPGMDPARLSCVLNPYVTVVLSPVRKLLWKSGCK